MPPYKQITDLLTNQYNPNYPWREQWDLIKEMARQIEEASAFLNNRVNLGYAIKDGICQAYTNHNMTVPTNSTLNALKENAIKKIESFRETPEYWQNIK